jgi:CheY-like chemotaxis protein
MVKKDKYDFVLMDINMPILGGIEATAIIKTMAPELVIIAQSAYALPGEIAKAMEAGCNDFISKPLNKENLLEMIYRHAATPAKVTIATRPTG